MWFLARIGQGRALGRGYAQVLTPFIRKPRELGVSEYCHGLKLIGGLLQKHTLLVLRVKNAITLFQYYKSQELGHR